MALINTLRMKGSLRAHPGVAWQAAYPEIEMGTPNGTRLCISASTKNML